MKTEDLKQNKKNYSSSVVEKFSTRSNNNPSTPKHYDIGIVGAGPAGIIAAIYAARAGKRVVLLEKNEQIGRKILATGNGRCNITNQDISISRYHGTDISFAEPILKAFDQYETIKFFESLGVPLKEEDRGRMFPRTGQATTVVDALRRELDRLGVVVKTGFTVKHVVPPVIPAQAGIQEPKEGLDSWPPTRNDERWRVASENSDNITVDQLILSTGGKASHQFGSSGDGLFWAKNLGHTIVPVHAALAPLETTETLVKEIMGIRLFAKATLRADDKARDTRAGDIIFTHFGVSGPAAMGLSSTASQLLSEGKVVTLAIDMLPDMESSEIEALIQTQANIDGKKAAKTIISGLVPKNLVPHILAYARIKEDTKAAEISKENRRDIVTALKAFPLTIAKVRPLKEAQVTAGGIATVEVGTDLQSKIVPHLYFAGEILDIDGDSGGFNLQWAWSSGKIAGEAAAGVNNA